MLLFKSVFLLTLVAASIGLRPILCVDDGTMFLSDSDGGIYACSKAGLARVYLYQAELLDPIKPIHITTFRDCNGNIYHSYKGLDVWVDRDCAIWIKRFIASVPQLE